MVSLVDGECEKIYYPNGVYEYVSKVVPHNGFWEVHVRRNSDNEWRVACWSRHRVSLKHKRDGWHWRRVGSYQTDPGYELKFTDAPIHFRVSNDYDAQSGERVGISLANGASGMRTRRVRRSFSLSTSNAMS